jgi:hypothetical protein
VADRQRRWRREFEDWFAVRTLDLDLIHVVVALGAKDDDPNGVAVTVPTLCFGNGEMRPNLWPEGNRCAAAIATFMYAKRCDSFAAVFCQVALR